ncbi:HAD family hydrolase [Cellulomonas sp. PSBB021]|uniref:HAD family hydrolase n=1 Tax=Cellulomonas sp. PSBB021 TaxID=2003551 RepID=UPI000B8D9A5A|nr:HAD family hydrolase [Cellulomonas sp. PSBB021]ASR54034.1 haloacid dehalogenase [Cellulomonas sp. PSBB021]
MTAPTRDAAPRATTGALVDGVLFDIDDTIVDTRSAFVAALAAVGARYLPSLPPEDAARRDEALLAMWRADTNGHYRRYTRGEVPYLEQKRARANELHATHGGPELDEAAFAAWDEVFDAAFRAAWVAHPETEAVLGTLLDAGLALGALSNAATSMQTAKLTAAGLVDRVPLLVAVDTLGFGKPDPRVFLEACRRLGTDPARTAYVGDEADVDALGARDAGLVGVWLDRPGARRHPVDEVSVTAVAVIRSLAELPDALGVPAGPATTASSRASTA